MTRLELAIIAVGEFLHSDPAEFTDYAKAKKEVMEDWYYISDAITASFKHERESTPNRIAKGRDAALSRRVPLERRVGRQNVTTE